MPNAVYLIAQGNCYWQVKFEGPYMSNIIALLESQGSPNMQFLEKVGKPITKGVVKCPANCFGARSDCTGVYGGTEVSFQSIPFTEVPHGGTIYKVFLRDAQLTFELDSTAEYIRCTYEAIECTTQSLKSPNLIAAPKKQSS